LIIIALLCSIVTTILYALIDPIGLLMIGFNVALCFFILVNVILILGEIKHEHPYSEEEQQEE